MKENQNHMRINHIVYSEVGDSKLKISLNIYVYINIYIYIYIYQIINNCNSLLVLNM